MNVAVGLGDAAALNIAEAQATQGLHRRVGLKMRYLIIDGMLSGTGVRDAVDGGY